MPADVQIHEMTGSAAGANKTSGTVRFKAADNTTVDNYDRLQVPPSGTTYSYTKQIKVYFNTAPSVDIANLRAYTDGNNNFGTGIGVQYDVQSSWEANINTNIAGTNLFSKTQGSPINLGDGPYTGTGYKGSFLRMQMTVASTASPGLLTAEQVTVAYDET